jgi:RNA polymerase sigma-70 factor (ECF subfamily)
MTATERLEHVGKLRPQLVRFARTRLLNPAHAEDAVQETLLAAIESIDSFSGSSSLYSWLTGILKHKLVDCVRRSAREQFQEIDIDGTPLDAVDRTACGMQRGPGACAEWDGPERALTRRRLWEALLHCVRDLPERTADTFVLRELVGMNTAETCRALAVSEANCAVMLHRARARIRERLAPEWADS